MLEALRAGARSYLTKDADRTDIATALRAAVGGLTVFDPRVHATLLAATSPGAAASPGITSATPRSAPATQPPDPPDGLTQREVEILSLIAQGLTNGEIAGRLFLSNHTIKTHINRIFAKTGSRDRVAAIAFTPSATTSARRTSRGPARPAPSSTIRVRPSGWRRWEVARRRRGGQPGGAGLADQRGGLDDPAGRCLLGGATGREPRPWPGDRGARPLRTRRPGGRAAATGRGPASGVHGREGSAPGASISPMRPDIRPGGIFPDYALPDHIGTVRKLSELGPRSANPYLGARQLLP